MAWNPFSKGTRAPGVRLSLAVLVVGCILPLAAVAAFLLFAFYEREQTQLTVNAISRARAMVSVVDREFAITQAGLQALATSNRLATGDLRGFHARAVEALPTIGAESIVVVDSGGQIVLSTWRPFGEPLPAVESARNLVRALETGKPGVSPLFAGPDSGRHVLTIAVPVPRDGSPHFSLNAIVAPARLLGVLGEQKLPDSWRASIIDSAGNVVVRSHEMEKFMGRKANRNILQRMARADEAGFESTTQDGIAAITVYSRSKATDWAVALSMPLQEVRAGLRQTLARLIAATVGAMVIGLWLAWLIGGRIAGSIKALIRPAIALGSGEALAVAPLHFKEANELRQALLGAESTLRKARHDAHHDALTGLPNRALFHFVVNKQLALCRRNNTHLAILFIDLDGFKAMNDMHGHALGDQLLVAVSIRIGHAIRESDTAARLGGDEFAVALVNCDRSGANIFARRLMKLLSTPYELGGIGATISASIGVAVFPESGTDVDTLLSTADHAMYEVKSQGKPLDLAATV